MTWNEIVEIMCIGVIALGVVLFFCEVYKGITETDEITRQSDCYKISKHLGEYMAYKESIGKGADNEKLLKKFEEIAKDKEK